MKAGNIILKQVEIGPMMNYAYLIGCPRTKEAAVVDPAWDVQKILNAASESGVAIKHILLTHGHPDHMNGVEQLLNATNAIVHIHRDEAAYMREAARTFGISTDFLAKRPENIHLNNDGDKLLIGDVIAQCIHTPGHTPGSQCFLIEGCLFSGDTLFVDACGRVDMPGGEPEKMWRSLNVTLKSLPDDVVLYPGHDYGGSPTSTMGNQKRTNPYMQIDSVQDFINAMG
jgi:glyoxylase-like metal-dependent hydrolase (beta-lactamase superfamily II)